MNSHDVGRDRGGVAAVLSKIKIPLHIVGIDTDRLFPPRLQQEIAELTQQVSTLHSISSPFGHDGFLIEVESVGAIIKNALNLQKNLKLAKMDVHKGLWTIYNIAKGRAV